MIKLIASDVDGTLIQDSTPDLYREMVETIYKLKKKGILFCAASGRQYFSLRNVFRDVADEIAYIAENGAHICYQNKNISVTPMKKEHIEGIMAMLRPYYGECETVVSTANGSLIESKNQEFIHLLTYGYHNHFRLVEDGKVKACMAGEEWVDFMDQSVDKGNGLKVLEKFLGICKEETMAFGDNNNDIGMMLAAGTSYAVDTAVKEVKKAADYVCPGWKDKGVYQIIQQKIFQGID